MTHHKNQVAMKQREVVISLSNDLFDRVFELLLAVLLIEAVVSVLANRRQKRKTVLMSEMVEMNKSRFEA